MNGKFQGDVSIAGIAHSYVANLQFINDQYSGIVTINLMASSRKKYDFTKEVSGQYPAHNNKLYKGENYIY